MTWMARAGKPTPAAMVIPQRKGVGLSALPQSKPSKREGGWGYRRGETAAGKRGRHRRHTHDSSGYHGGGIGKKGWGLLFRAGEARACAVEALGWPASQVWLIGVPTWRESVRSGYCENLLDSCPSVATWHSCQACAAPGPAGAHFRPSVCVRPRDERLGGRSCQAPNTMPV